VVVNHGPSSDVAEDVLATWDVGESTNDSIVGCAPMNTLRNVTLSAETGAVVAGTQAVGLAYNGANYFSATYPKGLGASWDLTARSGLQVSIQAIEPVSYGGWSPPGPTLVLCSAAGGYRSVGPAIDQLGGTAAAYT